MTKRIIRLVGLVSFFIVLSGCGQKGPLYMPPERETTDIEEGSDVAPVEGDTQTLGTTRLK